MFERTDAIIGDEGARVMREADWLTSAVVSGALVQSQGTPMADDNNDAGSRIASIPEPGAVITPAVSLGDVVGPIVVALLVVTGVLGLAYLQRFRGRAAQGGHSSPREARG